MSQRLTGIVDQDIESVASAQEILGRGAYAVEVSEIHVYHLNRPTLGGVLDNGFNGLLTLLLIANSNVQLGAGQVEGPSGLYAKSSTATSDQDCLVTELAYQAKVFDDLDSCGTFIARAGKILVSVQIRAVCLGWR